jgi:hypothetical protein
MARSAAVFSAVETLYVNALHPPGQLAIVLGAMPFLRLLRVDALLFGSTVLLVDTWVRGLFGLCASLVRVEVLSTLVDRVSRCQHLKRGGLKLWLRLRGHEVQFYAEYGPDSHLMPWLAESCRPLGELVL